MERMRSPAGVPIEPMPFGPRYLLTADRLAIESGPLAGVSLRVDESISPIKADFALYETEPRRSMSKDPVAHCHFDREPETGLETLWGIFVRAEYRHLRLTTLLVRLAFRRLLESNRRHWFAIRKLMQVDSEAGRHANPGSPRVSLHNIGIGLVAFRLGFQPEPDICRVLGPGNVRTMQVIEPEPPSPAGLLLRLNTLPGLLVAVMVNPDTGSLVTDPEAYERFASPRLLLNQALTGQLLVGNLDYVLPRSALLPFAARLADDRTELRHFTAALKRGARS